MSDKSRNKIIASNIKKYIMDNGITQKELAEAVGISPSTLSDYMNLRSNPSHGVIQRIADYFDINKSDIDTTYKEYDSIKIIDLYEKLDTDRKQRVTKFAELQLQQQEHNTSEYDIAVAAHIDESVDDEQLDIINKYIDNIVKNIKDYKK